MSREESFVTQENPQNDILLTPREVSDMFRVDPKTVARWAKAGKLSSTRTIGGHRRYYRKEIEELLGLSGEEKENQ
jgi:excisionase family DNA binding protein